jgi:ABC-type dipeptide/oligopeptide/nickel transport system ATPase component
MLENFTQPEALIVRNLTVSAGQKVLLELGEFSCKKGSIHAVIGESGSGKSLLLKSLMGLLKSNLSISGSAATTSLFPSSINSSLSTSASQVAAQLQSQAQISQQSQQPLSMAAKIAASEKAKQQQQQVQVVNPTVPVQATTSATLKKSTSSPAVSSTQVLVSPSPPPLPPVSLNDQDEEDALVNALNSSTNGSILSSSLLGNGVSPSGLPMLSPRMRFKGSVLSIVIREDKPHGFICVTKKREPELWSRVQREAPDTMRKLDGKDVATIVFQAADAVEGDALKPLGDAALQLLPTWKDAEVSFEVEYSARFKRYVAHRVKIEKK